MIPAVITHTLATMTPARIGKVRGCGSKTLTVVQLLASAAFITGGIVILILSKIEADNGKGELPVIWQTPPPSSARTMCRRVTCSAPSCYSVVPPTW